MGASTESHSTARISVTLSTIPVTDDYDTRVLEDVLQRRGGDTEISLANLQDLDTLAGLKFCAELASIWPKKYGHIASNSFLRGALLQSLDATTLPEELKNSLSARRKNSQRALDIYESETETGKEIQDMLNLLMEEIGSIDRFVIPSRQPKIQRSRQEGPNDNRRDGSQGGGVGATTAEGSKRESLGSQSAPSKPQGAQQTTWSQRAGLALWRLVGRWSEGSKPDSTGALSSGKAKTLEQR